MRVKAPQCRCTTTTIKKQRTTTTIPRRHTHTQTLADEVESRRKSCGRPRQRRQCVCHWHRNSATMRDSSSGLKWFSGRSSLWPCQNNQKTLIDWEEEEGGEQHYKIIWKKRECVCTCESSHETRELNERDWEGNKRKKRERIRFDHRGEQPCGGRLKTPLKLHNPGRWFAGSFWEISPPSQLSPPIHQLYEKGNSNTHSFSVVTQFKSEHTTTTRKWRRSSYLWCHKGTTCVCVSQWRRQLFYFSGSVGFDFVK